MILITGGVGFIGSHLAERLSRESEVRVIDNFSDYYSGKEGNVRAFEEKGIELVRGNILDRDTLANALKDVDTVFHLAAQPGVRYSFEKPRFVLETNSAGTLKLLEAARGTGVEKIVNASSSSVYGDAKIPFSEGQILAPISPYGISKLTAEQYCRLYSENYGLSTVSLRYFTVYGPRQRPDMAIRKFIELFSAGKAPTVYGDGKQTRDFTFVSDIVDGTILASKKKFSGEAFNLGGGTQTSLNHIIELIQKNLGTNSSPEYIGRANGDMQDTLASIERAKSDLGYSPKVSVDEGIKATVEWFKSAVP